MKQHGRIGVFLLPLIVFAGLVVLFIAGVNNSERRNELPSPLIGKTIPDFALPDLLATDTTVRSDDIRGRYTLINVWASWCFACRQEHDFLLSLAASGEVQVFGLNWRDTRPAATRWLNELGNPYGTIAFDGDGRTGIDFGVYGAPESFLVDPEGRIVAKHIGPLDAAIWANDMRPLLTAGSGS